MVKVSGLPLNKGAFSRPLFTALFFYSPHTPKVCCHLSMPFLAPISSLTTSAVSLTGGLLCKLQIANGALQKQKLFPASLESCGGAVKSVPLWTRGAAAVEAF